jgi:hypothetical protein
MTRLPLLLAALLALPSAARAGLHYSGESVAELPSRWRGFLIDHRALRSAGREKPGDLPPSPLRDEYLAAARKLDQAAAGRPLTADELADRGALHVRLGTPEKAVELLRPASRRFPEHFRIAANLGTAWQLAGDLEQASVHLEDAVRLAPEKLRDAERLHLKLVRLRLKEGRAAANPEAVDDLFGVRYVGDSGAAEPGRVAAAELKKLPPHAAALVQQLALWLPADGRLLWQAGELANAHGDVLTAAAVLDGCVTEFGMGSPDLRRRRQVYRAAADELAAKPDHDPNRGTLAFKSARPLLRTLDESSLPPVRPDRPTPLVWPVLGATTFAAGKPAFPKYLEKLDGTPVTVHGYVQSLGKDRRVNEFLLLEYPVGCWFCETPEPTGLVSVELRSGTKVEPRRGLVMVTGTLQLNRDDPERYLYRLTEARIADPE